MEPQLLHARYARALRAIGQDLGNLFPEDLEVEASGESFVARGLGRLENPDAKNKEEEPARRRLWQKWRRPSGEAQPTRSTFTRTYTPADIKALDEIGRARRTGSVQTPDVYSLAERLRMIGSILDEQDADMVKLSQAGNTMKFQYRDGEGEIHFEEYSTLTLYKLQRRYHSERRYQPENSCQAVGH